MKKEHLAPTEIYSKDDITNRAVAVYFNMASMSPPIELHAALVRDLLSRGNKVTVYLLNGSFRSSIENPFNRLSIRWFSAFRARDALRDLPVRIKYVDLETETDIVPEAVATTLELGVMSSLASATKAQSKAQLNRRWIRVYDEMLLSAKYLYNYFCKEIIQESYDFLFMFNGRFGCVKPALEAARTMQIGFGVYDVKKTIHEVVFVNELVHSIEGNTKKAFAAYAADKEHARENAETFFEKKVKNENTGDPIYTKEQTHGELPEAVLQTTKHVIAVYPSTEDEYKFIGKEWDGYVPESQVDEIEALAQTLPEEEYLIVVKMHPNQANTAEGTRERYLQIAGTYPHVVVEDPFSKKDTYALMQRADVTVTFASTIGVEACYAGKPVVLIGDTTWSHMNVAHKVHTGEEAGRVIIQGIDPRPQEGAVIWGNYLATYKDALPGYELRRNGDYRVDGRKIGRSTILRLLQLPAKLEIEMSKPGFQFNFSFFTRILDALRNVAVGKWAIK